MSIEFNHPVFDEGDVWREESWTFHQGSHVPGFMPLHNDVCVFHEGQHYPSPTCPHYNGEDPFDLEPGWTVLNLPKG